MMWSPAMEGKLIGSGFLKFEYWKKNVEIKLAANKEHFFAPKYDARIFRVIPSAEALLGNLQKGEIDMIASYAGDPVEISVAYLFIGLCYYYEADYSNAMIALRRSIEEDQTKEVGREGDMGITNFFMGESFSRFERWDDAAVAYRRAAEFYPELVPAWIRLWQLEGADDEEAEEI